jgi:hydrogenase maturation protease
MTLTDDEKREMGQSDERARQMLERTETMPVEQLMKLHGVLRGLRPLDSRSPNLRLPQEETQ